METKEIEKIVLGFKSTRPKGSVHSAFCQMYLKTDNLYDLGKRLTGELNMPPFDLEDDWNILFTYGAGYQGGGIYDWFAGFLVSSPQHGDNFIFTDDFDEGGSCMSSAILGLGMSSELEMSDGLDVSFNLTDYEKTQIQMVITAWQELFKFDEDEDGNELITIKSQKGELPKEFKKKGGHCFSCGPESDWEDGIGIFSDHWSFTAKFRE